MLLYTGFVLHVVFFLTLFYFFNRTFKMRYVLIMTGILAIIMWFLLDSTSVSRYIYPLVFMLVMILWCFVTWFVMKRKVNKRQTFN